MTEYASPAPWRVEAAHVNWEKTYFIIAPGGQPVARVYNETDARAIVEARNNPVIEFVIEPFIEPQPWDE